MHDDSWMTRCNDLGFVPGHAARGSGDGVRSAVSRLRDDLYRGRATKSDCMRTLATEEQQDTRLEIRVLGRDDLEGLADVLVRALACVHGGHGLDCPALDCPAFEE